MRPPTTEKVQPDKGQITTTNGNTNGNGTKLNLNQTSLSQQYGGIHSGTWVDRLPSSWIPYIQLARLSPPVAITLIYFPHLFGVLHAAILLDSEPLQVLQTAASLLLGTIFFSNAAHAWNDLIDYPIDTVTSRTKNRPIPRGAISPRNAFFFALSQGIGALLVLYHLTPASSTAFYAVPNILATIYYPFAKRHTNLVQLVLGFCLGWGVIMGSSAMGVNPIIINNALPSSSPTDNKISTYGITITTTSGTNLTITLSTSTALLFLASATWTILYDTIYAHQDLPDDLVNGVKSLAVLFQGATKSLLWVLLAIMTSSLVFSGQTLTLTDMEDIGGNWFGYIAAAGSGIALGGMILGVKLSDSGSCWWWFKYGYWLTGGSITLGLVVQYLLVVW